MRTNNESDLIRCSQFTFMGLMMKELITQSDVGFIRIRACVGQLLGRMTLTFTALTSFNVMLKDT